MSTKTCAHPCPSYRRLQGLSIAMGLAVLMTSGILPSTSGAEPSNTTKTISADLKTPESSQSGGDPLDPPTHFLWSSYLQANTMIRDIGPSTFNEKSWESQWLGPEFKYKEWPTPCGGGPNFSAFDPNSEQCAQTWVTSLAPLGLRCTTINKTWQRFPGFDKVFPAALKDAEGRIFRDALEVIEVMKGGPADGYLEPGDLIIAMDGEPLLDALLLEPTLAYKTRELRSLSPHAGWLIDRAEGRGSIRLEIIRGIKDLKIPPPARTWTEVNDGDVLPADTELLIATEALDPESCRLTSPDGRKNIPLSHLAVAANDKRNNTYLIPDSTWIIGGISKSHVKALRKLRLPSQFETITKIIDLRIPRIGSFSDDPLRCEKTRNLVDMNSAWLLKQQLPDGSWPRRGGYCSPVLDTSIAILALLSSGEDKYIPAVKKGADYLTKNVDFNSWGAPVGLCMAALGEYWLRTHDDSVIDAMRVGGSGISRYIYGDYTSGHGAVPGYGDGGVNYGGAHLALGLALLEKTPARGNPDLLDKMLWRVQQMAPDGYVPYSRTGSSFDKQSDPNAYGARGGPYLVAARLHGGPSHFIEAATNHYCVRTLGSGDQGHATKSFSLFGSTIAIACSDQVALREFLRRFSWSITLNRRFDGGFSWSSERLEYMGGEDVMHDIYRTSVHLILLNACKHTLAITGRQDLFPSKQYSLPKLTDADRKIWQAYLASWELVKLRLGHKAPPALGKAITAMRSWEKTEGEQMKSKLLQLVETQSPEILAAIKADNTLDAQTRLTLIEMILGINHQIDFVTQSKGDGPDGREILQATGISITSCQGIGGRSSNYPATGTITLHDPSGKILPQDIVMDIRPGSNPSPRVKFDPKTFSNRLTVPLAMTDGDSKGVQLVSRFSLEIAGEKFDFDRTVTWPEQAENNRLLWLPGTVDRDHFLTNLAVRMADGFVMETAYGRSVEAPVPMAWNNRQWDPREDGDFQLIKGMQADFAFQIQQDRVVPVTVAATRNPRFSEPQVRSVTGDISPIANLYDWSPSSLASIELGPLQQSSVIWSLAHPATIQRAFVLCRNHDIELSIEASSADDPRWIPISACFKTGGLKFLIPGTYSRLRLNIRNTSNKKNTVEVGEVHFYSP